MSSRRRIGLVSRRQPDRLIKQEFDNLMNEIDSAEGSSDRVEDVPDVPVPTEPIAVQLDNTDSDKDNGEESAVSSENGDNSDDGDGDSFHNGDSDEDEEIQDPLSFKDALAEWVRKSCISRDATNDLLRLLLINGHPDLPTTYEALLKTPRVHGGK